MPQSKPHRHMQHPVTQAQVRELLSYDAQTGAMTWRASGKAVGSFDGRRVRVCIGGQRYMVHRIAWLYVHGEWPKRMIDHINGDPRDNRMANLRDVPPFINSQNRRAASVRSKTRVLGVVERRNRFSVAMSFMGHAVSVHGFETKEEASSCYLNLKRRLHDGCSI